MTKILLIEDEKVLRENTSELLELHGFECIIAEHGKIGLEKALTEKPDLIICDIMLPHLNGYQIKEALNNLNEQARIPFIFLSAKIEREDIKKGMDLGADDYITKPFRIAELVFSIKNRLEKSRYIQSAVSEPRAIDNIIHLSKQHCNMPLNGIINLSGILNSKHSNPPEFLEKSLLAINKSSKQLYKTLNNVIDLVRLKHYNNPVDEVHTLINIKSIIEQTLSERSDHYNYFGEKKINLHCEESILALEQDIEIIAFELIDNMFKFSTSNIINISLGTKVASNNKWINLSVSNNISKPISFSMSDVQPFNQLQQNKEQSDGSGLGLSLIKLIVQKYSGTIKIDTSDSLLFCIVLTFPNN